MLEGTNISKDEDLSEFSDYLAEFDSLIGFDAETCPVCGIELSSTLSIRQSQFFKYKCFDKEFELALLTKLLDSKGIPYKIEKRLNTELMSEIGYVFEVLVPLKYLTDLENIY